MSLKHRICLAGSICGSLSRMDWPLLGPLSSVERSELLASARSRRFAREQVIFHEGDLADTVHLIRSGRAAVRVSSPAGDVVTLNILSAGDYFGELSLLRNARSRRRTATLVALEDLETLALSANAFHAVCDRYPKVERLLVAFLAQRVEELSHRLLEALYVSVDRRVYRRLVELAEIYRNADECIAIPLRQEHVADLAGATRPTVNQVLQKLSSQGIVELHRGRIDVLDVPALRRRAGHPSA
jgi:CRP/FNR family transcriptional regulator, cyclic AMP receptor protein